SGSRPPIRRESARIAASRGLVPRDTETRAAKSAARVTLHSQASRASDSRPVGSVISSLPYRPPVTNDVSPAQLWKGREAPARGPLRAPLRSYLINPLSENIHDSPHDRWSFYRDPRIVVARANEHPGSMPEKFLIASLP